VTRSRRPTSRSTAPDAPSSIGERRRGRERGGEQEAQLEAGDLGVGAAAERARARGGKAATMRLDGGHPALDLVNTVYGAGRRWCSMADCGTEAKKRRYVQRRRERRAAASM
jgi:hypothetical protein